MINLWKFYGVHNFSGRLDFHKILVLCFFAIPNILSLPPPLAEHLQNQWNMRCFEALKHLNHRKVTFCEKWYFCEKVTFLGKSLKKSLFHKKVTFSQKSNFSHKSFPGSQNLINTVEYGAFWDPGYGRSHFCEKVIFL